MNWTETVLGEVTSQKQRRVLVAPGQHYDLLGVRWYGEGPFLRETVDSDTSKASHFFRVQEGDFIYNRLFAWKGSFGVIGSQLAGCCVSGEFPIFSVDSEMLLPEYLNLVMCRQTVWSQIEKESTGSTAASRNRWKEDRFREFPILLPSLAEQRRILDLICVVDEAIQSANIGAQCSSLATSLLDEAAEGSEHQPLSDLVVRAKAGGTPSRSDPTNYGGSIPWLKSGEVEGGAIVNTSECITEKGLAASSTWLMPPKTIVVAMYGQGLTAGSVGITAVAMTSNQAVLGIEPDDERVDRRFLFHWLRTHKDSMRSRRSGSSQPNLNKDLVLQEQIPLPSLSQQRSLAGALDALLEEELATERWRTALLRLRKGLLDDLLSCKHEISKSYDSLLSA